MQSVLTATGIGVGILIGLTGWFSGQLESVNASVQDKGERISALEATYKVVDDRLGRIEEKLDQALAK